MHKKLFIKISFIFVSLFGVFVPLFAPPPLVVSTPVHKTLDSRFPLLSPRYNPISSLGGSIAMPERYVAGSGECPDVSPTPFFGGRNPLLWDPADESDSD